MDPVLLSLGEVLLGGSFSARRRNVAIFLAVVGTGLFLYVVINAWSPNEAVVPAYELTSDADASGQWFKLNPKEKPGERPIECRCTVTSFSRELQWRLKEQAVMQRERAWGPGEIIMKWPDDFSGPRGRPAPGRYEIECSALIAAADESVVRIEPVILEFHHE